MPNRKFPSIPDPVRSLDGMFESVHALKQAVEFLSGQTGDEPAPVTTDEVNDAIARIDLTLYGKLATANTWAGHNIYSSGVDFGSQVGASVTDLSKHIALFSSVYGFSITASRQNYVVPATAAHKFVVNGVDVGTFDVSGLTTLALAATTGTFSGTLQWPSNGGLGNFKLGTGDGASYTTYNTIFHGHWGLGMEDYSGAINGFYDFRAGKWDVKDGYYLNTVRIPFHKAYESAQQTITLAGALTLAHGLGVKPKLVLPVIQCTTAELGYSIGDEIPLSPGVFSLVSDATNINVRYGSVALVAIHKTTGVATNITAASWRLVARAWA